MRQQSYFPNPLKPNTRLTSAVKRRLSSMGSKSSRHSSFGSLIHPSIGIPFAIKIAVRQLLVESCEVSDRTLVDSVGCRRVVDEANSRQVSVDDAQILDVSAVRMQTVLYKRAVLSAINPEDCSATGRS